MFPQIALWGGVPAKVICTMQEFIDKHSNELKKNECVYWDIKREELSKEDLEKFNKDIDGRIVYICDSKK